MVAPLCGYCITFTTIFATSDATSFCVVPSHGQILTRTEGTPVEQERANIRTAYADFIIIIICLFIYLLFYLFILHSVYISLFLILLTYV